MSCITKGAGYEGSDITCMARIQMNGANITQSDISAIERKIFDLDGDGPDTAEDTSTPSVSTVVFDTLQTDGRWTKGGTGYNFRQLVGGALFPEANRRYLIEYKFTGDSGEIFYHVWENTTRAIRGS